MIGKQRKREITSKRDLLSELQNSTFDKVAVFEQVQSAQEAESYIRQNRNWHHSIVVISHK
jgi:ADP-glucose pyrophosphorylase